MAEPALHPDLEPLALLLGTWSGEGTGRYPTIHDFQYGEEIVVAHNGKPFLSYRQRTWALDDGRPLHGESGYWRVAPGPAKPSSVELVVAHPSGVVEVEEGAAGLDAGELHIELATTTVRRTGTAKEVTALARRFRVGRDRLSYELDMAAVGQPLLAHLAASLTRR